MICGIGVNLGDPSVPQEVIQPGLAEKFFDGQGTEPLIVSTKDSNRKFGSCEAFLVCGIGATGLVVQGEAEINGFAVAFHSPSVLTERPVPCATCFGGPQFPILVGDQVCQSSRRRK